MMRVDERRDASSRQLRILFLLVGSLLLGMMSFVILAVLLSPQGVAVPGGSSTGPMGPTGGTSSPAVPMKMLLLGLGVLSVGSFGAFVTGGKVAEGQACAKWATREDDEKGREAILQILFASTILRAALAEAPGLTSAVLVLLGGTKLPLSVVGVSAVLLVSLLPVRSRLVRLEERATGMRAVM